MHLLCNKLCNSFTHSPLFFSLLHLLDALAALSWWAIVDPHYMISQILQLILRFNCLYLQYI